MHLTVNLKRLKLNIKYNYSESGTQVNSLTHCQCSFAVPFDEDDRDDSVWFLDHDYLENMYGMFKKVNGKALSMLSAFV